MGVDVSVKVLLAKYIPDRRRGEPRNVGVLVVGKDGPGVVRFLGQDEAGEVDGRRLPRNLVRDLEAYKLWVSYWQDAARVGLEALDRLEEADSPAYYVVEAGEILRDPQIHDVEALARRYFGELVTDREAEEKTTASTALKRAVNRLVESPAIGERAKVELDYSVELVVKNRVVNLPFQYAFINGHISVGQRVLLSDEPHAYAALGKARSLPEDFGQSVAFVLSDEFTNLKDDSDVYWLLDERCKVIQADLETAEGDLAAAIAE